MKKQFVIIIASFVMILLSTLTVVFAWFSILEKTQNILIYSGKLNLDVSLYEVNGSNENEIEDIEFINISPGDRFYFKLTFDTSNSTLDGSLNVNFNFSFNQAWTSLVEVSIDNDVIVLNTNYQAISNKLFDENNNYYELLFDVYFNPELINSSHVDLSFSIDSILINYEQI